MENRKILMQKGLKLLKVLSPGDKTERTDHAKGYNPVQYEVLEYLASLNEVTNPLCAID
jgi:hypothetical protein